MGRKAVEAGGKKDEIIAAALELFLENGYENTSIRSIQGKVGSEVGLFYYYFKDKDAVFEQALELFFAGYRKELDAILAEGRRNPCRLINRFFSYMEQETVRFRARYAQKLHWTVRRAIREQTLEVIEPYLTQVVEILMDYGATPRLDPAVAVMFLTHGVGSMLLHEEREKFVQKRAEIKKGIHLIMGLDPDTAELMYPVFADAQDADGCLALAEENHAHFPGWERDAFAAQLNEYIRLQSAVVVRLHGVVQGLILFSRQEHTIDYLLCAPRLARRGVGGRLLETAVAQFPVGETVSLVTFRADDAAGAAARGLYRRFGFTEAEPVEMFGYPCQRLVLVVPAEAPGLHR